MTKVDITQKWLIQTWINLEKILTMKTNTNLLSNLHSKYLKNYSLKKTTITLTRRNNKTFSKTLEGL